jgi:hypothetical protein
MELEVKLIEVYKKNYINLLSSDSKKIIVLVDNLKFKNNSRQKDA